MIQAAHSQVCHCHTHIIQKYEIIFSKGLASNFFFSIFPLPDTCSTRLALGSSICTMYVFATKDVLKRISQYGDIFFERTFSLSLCDVLTLPVSCKELVHLTL